MDGIRDALTERLGPFALWQWLAILAAGIALSMWLQRAWMPDDDGDDDGDDQGRGRTGPRDAVGGGGGFEFIDDQGRYGVIDDGTPSDNDEWLAAASDAAADEGYRATLVDRALRRYLTGQSLGPEELDVLDVALSTVGTPPDGAPPIVHEPADDDPADDGNGDGDPAPPPPSAPAPPPSDPTPPDDDPEAPAPPDDSTTDGDFAGTSRGPVAFAADFLYSPDRSYATAQQVLDSVLRESERRAAFELAEDRYVGDFKAQRPAVQRSLAFSAARELYPDINLAGQEYDHDAQTIGGQPALGAAGHGSTGGTAPADDDDGRDADGVTEAQVRRLFDRHGVDPAQHLDGSREDPDERVRRLAQSGRSLSDIEESVRRIARNLNGDDDGGSAAPQPDDPTDEPSQPTGIDPEGEYTDARIMNAIESSTHLSSTRDLRLRQIRHGSSDTRAFALRQIGLE